jgi:hypothetical protein
MIKIWGRRSLNNGIVLIKIGFGKEFLEIFLLLKGWVKLRSLELF